MQERRYRPGDVLDDYCPRERRITDHAIVAMIEDEIRRTRCAVCDAEHEYKEAKVPAPRRKSKPPALFNQVLEGMNGPTRPHPVPESASAHENSNELRRDGLSEDLEPAADAMPLEEAVESGPPHPVAAAEPNPSEPADRSEPNPSEPPEPNPSEPTEPSEPAEPLEGGFRRSLIRATFPRPDGQQPPSRDIPEFTIHSLHNRRNGQRHGGGQNKFRGGRRRPGGNLDHIGPMRFRDHGSGQNNAPGHGGGGRRRRGGKKNR
jgi:hypothetical protein